MTSVQAVFFASPEKEDRMVSLYLARTVPLAFVLSVVLAFGCSSSDNGGDGGSGGAAGSGGTAGSGGGAGMGGGGSGGDGGTAGNGGGGSGGDGGTAGNGGGGSGGDGGTAGDGGDGGTGGSNFPLLDPIAAWSFSGDAKDDTGNGNDGTVQGATLTDDRFGDPESAYSFDGDDTIGIGNNVKPDFPFTFSLWIRMTKSGVWGIIANDDVNSGGNRWGAFIAASAGETVVAGVFSGVAVAGTRRDVVTDENVLRVGEWQMISVVFASLLDTRVYVDGVEVPVVSNGGTGNSLIYSSAPGTIGSADRGGNLLPFQGAIDDVSVFDRALTDEEVQTLYGGFTTRTP